MKRWISPALFFRALFRTCSLCLGHIFRFRFRYPHRVNRPYHLLPPGVALQQRNSAGSEATEMSWNYRVFKDKNGYHSIRETHYEGKKLVGWSVCSMWPGGDDLESLGKDLKHMVEGLDKPVVDEVEYEKHLAADSEEGNPEGSGPESTEEEDPGSNPGT